MTIEEMKRLKEQRGYSFAQIAEYSGVPIGTVQKILTGITKNPRKATLMAIEKVFREEEAKFSGKAYNYETRVKDNLFLKESASAYGAATQLKKQGEYTIEDYRAIPDDRRVELIDGVMYDMDAPVTIHQRIIALLHIQICSYIEKNKEKCLVLFSPLDVQLDRDRSTMVQPDLVIVCDPSKVRKSGIYGAPDFVIEVLSDSTRKKDMLTKTEKYMSAGVKEYWMIDPKKKKLIVYNFMEEDFMPQIMPLIGEKGIALYQEKLKINLDMLREEIERFEKLQ